MKTKKSKENSRVRCPWVGDDERMQVYHDTVWGRPTKDDKEIFKAIVLDTNQAGLSWKCILHKEENFAKAYANFDAKKIAKFNSKDVARLMSDAGIIRNKLKILATISNAQKFLEIQKEYKTFAKYIWQFTGGKSIIKKPKSIKDYRATSLESDAMSKDMKARGFKFVGSTICYAFMQGIGMVVEHSSSCWLSVKR
ncbi:MAG: DNA-3-methyladenine glycosylase I [Candidatus Pacebacteria bacterium]|nr:DNA-3-methyladenine glycosylase I [Candidatus Paceibacterota bacterium]MBP9780882.1 DNA-3-methyladenine glycosylase I [Candidatus Paceibacterota bacterium]